MCEKPVEPDNKECELTSWWMTFPFCFSLVSYVAIVVVYIVRKDKELVLRCSTVAYSISTILFTILLISFPLFLNPNEEYYLKKYDSFIVQNIIVVLMLILYFYASSWMSALCFDVWLTRTFPRPGRRSTTRLWGYVAFTSAFPFILFGIISTQTFLQNAYQLNDPKNEEAAFFANLLKGSIWAILSVNFSLFLATAWKLRIIQHFDIQNQKKTSLLYFELVLLVGFRWVIDLLSFSQITKNYNKMNVKTVHVAMLLMLLHPILLFSFLVWNSEKNAFLETNYAGVKKSLAFLGLIGNHVKKWWDLRGHCQRHQGNATSCSGAIEPPNCSIHM